MCNRATDVLLAREFVRAERDTWRGMPRVVGPLVVSEARVPTPA